MKFFAMLSVILFSASCTLRSVSETKHHMLSTTELSERVGVQFHIHETTDSDAALFRASGMRLLRTEVVWSQLEREKGVYDFSWLDMHVGLAEAVNGRAIVIINYGNPLYEGQYPWKSEEAWSAFETMLRITVDRYSSSPVIWELWNEADNKGFWGSEPDPAEYFAWSARTVEVIRSIDPDACVVGPASSGMEFEWHSMLYSMGYLDLVDAITIHPYRNEHPKTLLRDVEKLRGMMIREGKLLPVIAGEWGYRLPQLSGAGLSRDFHAEMVEACEEAGVAGLIIYDWRGGAEMPLIDDVTLEPLPAYHVIHEMLCTSAVNRVSE